MTYCELLCKSNTVLSMKCFLCDSLQFGNEHVALFVYNSRFSFDNALLPISYANS